MSEQNVELVHCSHKFQEMGRCCLCGVKMDETEYAKASKPGQKWGDPDYTLTGPQVTYHTDMADEFSCAARKAIGAFASYCLYFPQHTHVANQLRNAIDDAFQAMQGGGV